MTSRRKDQPQGGIAGKPVSAELVIAAAGTPTDRSYHNKSTDPQEDQVGPFLSIGGKKESHSGQYKLHDKADHGTPSSKVVDGD